MRLYKKPIRKSELSANNPFFNKSISTAARTASGGGNHAFYEQML